MSEAPHRYTAAVADEIERRWQQRWDEDGTFHADNPVGELRGSAESLEDAAAATSGAAPEKMYIMDMFPYPSGAGLHVGHPLGYIATDVVARHQRMLGKNVLYTMGYDAFGLPAEQYAVQTGTHPRTTTESNIATMRRQLHRLGLSHDPRRSLSTTDPEFVKWTQWIFLRIFDSWYDPEAPNADGITGRARPIAELREELRAGTVDPYALAERQGIELPADWAGRSAADVIAASDTELSELADSFRLAYISETPVNWCPGLGTVLANEEVTAEGRSERGNFPVFTRRLRQWNMRITAFADRLIDDLDRVDWPESIRAMQRNWIGRSHGAQITFPVSGSAIDGGGVASFDVFTTRADTLFGATFCVLSPEHTLLAEPSTLPAQWPAGTKDAWTGGAESPRAAVAAYQARAAALDEDERTADDREKTGVFTGLFATNPMDGRELPVFTADYVLTGYGTGAIMAVPAEDARDFEFAARFDLPVIRTVRPPTDFEGGAWTGTGEKINSASAELDLNGLDLDEAKTRATAYAEEQGFGRARTTFRLRDWLFSRQRYWGEPFPIVYDPAAPRGADPAAGGDAARGPAGGRGLLPQDLRPGGRGHRAADTALARHRVGRGRAGPGRGPQALPARDEHDAAVGRLLLVPPALHRSHRGRGPGAPGERAVLAGYPRGRRRGRRGPVRRRGGARGAAPAVRPVLAQGAVRPRGRLQPGTVPPPVQPGVHPGLRLHRCPRRPRPGGGGRGRCRRHLHLSGRARHPGVREDGQVAEERGGSRRHVRGVRRGHTARVRDVDGPAGPVPAVGDPRRGRLTALPAAAVAPGDR